MDFSPSARFTYETVSKNREKYVASESIGDGKAIIITEYKYDSRPIYDLYVYNKHIGLYFKNFKTYDKKMYKILENNEFRISGINVGNKYYYVVGLDAMNINKLEINGTLISELEEPFCFFMLDEEITSIKINDMEIDVYSFTHPDLITKQSCRDHC